MTPHNSAHIGEIAPFVLVPGDPNRATVVAQRYLHNPKMVSDVRGIPAYTGTFEGVDVSVMASGMGAPSCGIYTYELYTQYDVSTIVRIGTCGGLSPKVQVGALVLAMTASTDSNWAHQYQLKGTFSPACDAQLLVSAMDICKEAGIAYHAGMVFSSDLFSSYNAMGEESWKPWARMGALAQDMETYALYSNAAFCNKRCLSILTMTDSCVTGDSFPDDQRMRGNYPMIETALALAVRQHA